MPNYNSTLQINNTNLQDVLETLKNKAVPSGGTNTTDATAVASDILSGKTAYIKTGKVTGNIPTRDSSDITTNGAIFTVPSGYYATQVSKSVDTATQATPNITINASGLITATATQTEGYVIDGTKTATKQLAFQSAKTITPSSTSQIAVSSGYYTGGNITVNGDSNLIAENIKSGVSIFGVAGNYEGNGSGSGNTEMEELLVTRTITSYENSKLTSIGGYAFGNCYSLTSVNLPACTNIGYGAFYNCSSLTSVNIPECTRIPNEAFAYCYSLTSVSFPVCTSVGSSAFKNCNSLTSVSFPACTYIENSAFMYCAELTSANFPVCTIVDQYAFDYCSKLTSANFPKCTFVSLYAFASCTSLTSVSFPVCTRLSSDAFMNCTSLTSVNLPACTYIDNGAFYNCTSLTSVNLPACTNIKSFAFSKCTRLISLYLTGSSLCTLANSNAFSSTPIDGYTAYASGYGSIFVPASLLTSYKTATNWTYFSSRFVGV